LQQHIQAIIALPAVEVDLVRSRGFKVVLDPVNSSGALAVPALLEYLGCEVLTIHGEPNGHFAHNPEPLPEHLHDLSAAILEHGADLGIAVDPDVDRLALVCENGEAFGEEYTLVAVADYLLQQQVGNTVSNLSSSRALRDVTLRHGGQYFAAAVGEVNVVEKMKAVHAVIGGEGNGGIIVPDLHYGRDALVGIALFLSWLAKFGGTASALRATYPDYQMVKDKIALPETLDMEALLQKLATKHQHEQHSTIDGLKIDFAQSWLHLRKSNTEPIIRIYAEAPTLVEAEALVRKIKLEMVSDLP
jgi:phosphomannomutase